jgi:hypothetical protein
MKEKNYLMSSAQYPKTNPLNLSYTSKTEDETKKIAAHLYTPIIISNKGLITSPLDKFTIQETILKTKPPVILPLLLSPCVLIND